MYDGTNQNQSFTLDGLGRILKAIDRNEIPNLDDNVTIRYEYDSLGRVRKEGFGENAGSPKWVTESEYNAHGFRNKLKYPGLGGWPTIELNYTFDKLGRLTNLVDPNRASPDDLLLALTYTGASRLLGAKRSDGSFWTAHDGATWNGGTLSDFDKAGRRKKGRVRSGSTTWFEEQIDYDLNDQVVQVKWPYGRANANETETVRYTYDQLGRLTNFDQGVWNGTDMSPETASHDWTLDEQGNWRKHKDETVTTEWQLSVDPVNAYTQWKRWYDLNGDGTNETQGPLTLHYDSVKSFLYERELNPAESRHPRRALRYLHDSLGRLARIDKDVGGTITTLVSYGYDTQNRLAWRKEGTNDRVWLIYDGGQVIAEQTETTRLKSYVWAGSQLIQSRDQGGLELHHHQDRLGSVVLSTKKNGSTTQLHGRAQFDPYGRKVKQVGWEANGLGTVYGYAGMRLDETAKLYVMGHRWYDPEMGRFIQQDPIGESGGYNLYAYVNSSPVMWTDPTGLLRWLPGAAPPQGPFDRGPWNDAKSDAKLPGYSAGTRTIMGQPVNFGAAAIVGASFLLKMHVWIERRAAQLGLQVAGLESSRGEGKATDGSIAQAVGTGATSSFIPMNAVPHTSAQGNERIEVVVRALNQLMNSPEFRYDISRALFAVSTASGISFEKLVESLQTDANGVNYLRISVYDSGHGSSIPCKRDAWGCQSGHQVFIDAASFVTMKWDLASIRDSQPPTRMSYEVGPEERAKLEQVVVHEIGHFLGRLHGWDISSCGGCNLFNEYQAKSGYPESVGDLAHSPPKLEGIAFQALFNFYAIGSSSDYWNMQMTRDSISFTWLGGGWGP